MDEWGRGTEVGSKDGSWVEGRTQYRKLWRPGEKKRGMNHRDRLSRRLRGFLFWHTDDADTTDFRGFTYLWEFVASVSSVFYLLFPRGLSSKTCQLPDLRTAKQGQIMANLHPAINRLENGIKMKGEILRGSVQAINSKVLPFTV